ncbi:MAG: tetratricopeptide repeat protein [Phycisphaerales bacterium]|nr:tetratricopeptide repeat protein [Phycisphaerales bacterium]
MSGGGGSVLERAQGLMGIGRFAEALEILRTASRTKPKDVAVLTHMAMVLLAMGEAEQAEFTLLRAAQFAPDDALVQGLLGSAYVTLGDGVKGERALRRHVQIVEKSAAGWSNLGVALVLQKRMTEAEDALRRAVELDPTLGAAAQSLAQLLIQTARCEEALTIAWARGKAEPGDGRGALSAAASAAAYAWSIKPDDVAEIHRAMGDALQKAMDASVGGADSAWFISARGLKHWNEAEPRPLKVGLVSPDLCDHAVARFVRALLEHHDRREIEITAYSVGGRDDEMRRRLKPLCARWRDFVRGTDKALAEQVRKDGIHVLIDMAGNTAMHRLGAFALRAAPVQISAWGYPATTGLGSMDYRLVDAITDPAGSERWLSEKPMRLEGCFTCFAPDEGSEGLVVERSGERGPVVFGSFNNIAKISAPCAALWGKVLKAVPGSRLALKSVNLREPRVIEVVRKRLEEGGVEWGRVEILQPTADVRSHLGVYSAVDVALDTVPYAGTTTTCEALVMGVPVVVLEDSERYPMHAARVGVSLLTAAGCERWIGRGEEGFVEVAKRLAGDIESVRSSRRALSAKVRSSAMCDGKAYALRLTEAIRRAWAERAGASLAAGREGAER